MDPITTNPATVYYTYGALALIVLAFFFVARRDLLLLFHSRVKANKREKELGMSRGVTRIWAVGRTTMLEAWAGRVWLLPILWLITSLILLSVVRGYDDSELIPLYIRVLLSGQEILLMVMIWVMACISLPKDRERKIIITNASKPLSRLEIVLGKMVGFSAITAVLLVVMGLVTWGVLAIENARIRSNAAVQYNLAKSDYTEKSEDQRGTAARPESLKRLADDGSLFAYNYVTVPKGDMSIVGKFERTANGTVRYLKGGSYENVTYRFSPRILARTGSAYSAPGAGPFFWFHFPISYYVDSSQAPKRVQIQVTAVRAKNPLHQQTTTLTLDPEGVAQWEPTDLATPLFTPSDDLNSFSSEDDLGEVDLTINCSTAGVFLKILEGAALDPASNSFPPGTEFNMLAVPDRTGTISIPPLPNPVMRGFERNDRQQINGPDRREAENFGTDIPVEYALYRFRGQDLRHIPIDEKGNFTLSFNMDVDRMRNQAQDTMAVVQVTNLDAPTVFQTFTMPVIEKRTVPLAVPASFLGDNDPSKRGDLIVSIQCRTSSHSISLAEDSIRVEQPPSFFVTTLMKSEFVIFLETVLLIIVSVACSVRLGWPVAMLTAAGCYTLGYLTQFLYAVQDQGGLTALGYVNYSQRHGLNWFLDIVTGGLWKFLSVLSSLMPDFSKFDPLEYITQLRNMPFSTLGEYLLITVLFALPFIALGYFFIRKQELG